MADIIDFKSFKRPEEIASQPMVRAITFADLPVTKNPVPIPGIFGNWKKYKKDLDEQ